MICRRRCRRQRCIVVLPRNGKKERRDSACLPVVFSDDYIQFGTVVASLLKFENVVLYVVDVGDDDALLVRPYPPLLMFF